MRIASILAVAALAGSAAAQTEAVVRAADDVRGGPSDIFPVTGTVRPGQRVRVVKEFDRDWLAVQPPPGSSSWIMDRVLSHEQPPGTGRRTIATVLGDDVPVWLGTADRGEPHKTETAKLKRGTLVVVLGDKATADGTQWWRIECVPSEVRFVPRRAVEQATGTTAPPVGVAALPTSRTPTPTTTAAKAVPPLWTQAEQAEQAGRTGEAELLYRQLASEAAQPGGDHELAIRCYNRLAALGQRPASAGQVAARPTGLTPPAAPASSTPPPATATSCRSGPGYLRRCAFAFDGQPAYVLEDARGQPRLYVVGQAGLSLEPFVNRHVELFGPLVRKAELSNGYYMVTNVVQPLR